MPKILNPNGPGVIDVSDDEVKKYSQSQEDNSTVIMTDPSTGKTYDVPSNSVQNNIKFGWKVITPEEEKEQRNIKDEVSKESATDIWKKNFINEGLFGIPQTKEDLTSTPEQLRHNQLIREEEEKQHPLAYWHGKGSGFVSSLAIPGVGEAGEAARIGVEGAGKVAERAAVEGIEKGALETSTNAGINLGTEAVKNAAETSLARKVAGSAAKYATEGAIYSTPQAAVQATYGDPETAAETMLWGTGLSGLFGGAGRLVGEGASGILDRNAIEKLLSTKQANGLTVADDLSKSILGYSDKFTGKIGVKNVMRDIRIADEEGILSADPKNREAMIDALGKDAGSQLGDYRDNLEDSLKKSDLKSMAPKFNDMADELQKAGDDIKGINLSANQSAKKYLDDLIQDIRSFGNDSEPSFKKVQELREIVKNTTNAYQKKTIQAQIGRLADEVISKHLDVSAQQLFAAGENPEDYAGYLKQMERYAAFKNMNETIPDFQSGIKLPKGGLTSVFHGITPVLALLSGHPYVAAGDFALKSFLNNRFGLLGKSASYLRKVAADPVSVPLIGGLMAKEGVAALDEHISSIPDIITRDKTTTHLISDAMGHLNSTQGLSHDQQYDKVVKQLQMANVDNGYMAQQIGQQSAPFTTNSVQLGSAVINKKMNALSYLASQIPNPPPAQPFQDNSFEPTKLQKMNFKKQLAIQNNPMVVWKHFADGEMDGLDKQTMMAVYPKIYQRMVDQILQTAYDPRMGKVSANDRLQLSLFTGIPLDQSLKNISSIQQAVAAQQPQQHPQEPKPKRASSRPKFGHEPSYMTDSQRRTYGRGT